MLSAERARSKRLHYTSKATRNFSISKNNLTEHFVANVGEPDPPTPFDEHLIYVFTLETFAEYADRRLGDPARR